MDVEAVRGQIDRQGPHFLGYRAIGPAVEDAPRVGTEGYDVAEDFERGEGLVDDGRVALANTFYGRGEATEA